MKFRSEFVTNSSSASFVLSMKEIPIDVEQYILSNFNRTTSEELLANIQKSIEMPPNLHYNSVQELIDQIKAYVDSYVKVYNLVDYQAGDEYMHIWVRRDEMMNDENVDEYLYNFTHDEIPPKFNYHY